MLLSSASRRARRALGAGIVAIVVGSAVAYVAGMPLAGMTAPASAAPALPVFSISPTTGSPGNGITTSGTMVTVSGTLCEGVVVGAVHVHLYQGVKTVPQTPPAVPPTADALAEFVTGSAADGSWSGAVEIPMNAVVGDITFLASCTSQSPFWYSQVGAFTVVDAQTTTTVAPTTTSSVAPTTTSTMTPTTTSTVAPTTTTVGSTTTTAGNPTTTAPAVAARAVAAAPTFTG